MITNRMRRRIIDAHVNMSVVLLLEVSPAHFLPFHAFASFYARRLHHVQVKRTGPAQLNVTGIKRQVDGLLKALATFPQPVAVNRPNETALWVPLSVVRQQLGRELAELMARIKQLSLVKGVAN